MTGRSRWTRTACLGWLLAVVLVAACGGTRTATGSPPAPPTPTPGDLSAVQAALALRGVTIHQVVSGDAGCPGVAGLHSNAARLVVSLAGEGRRYDVFLFRWRRPADFETAAEPFSRCLDDYAARAAGDVAIEGIEIAPWRAYGPDWSDDMLSVLEAALRDVGGG